MYDTYVVLQGWVGAEPVTTDTGRGPVTKIRVACTPRYYKDNQFHDGETTWYTVNAWRTLGTNVARSVHQGDPVVVRGRLKSDVWKRDDGTPSVTQVVEALFVGHDLTRGTTTFVRTPREERPSADEEPAVKEMNHADDPWGPPVTSEGVAKEGVAA